MDVLAKAFCCSFVLQMILQSETSTAEQKFCSFSPVSVEISDQVDGPRCARV